VDYPHAQPFVDQVQDNMTLFRMAARFSDPLFEKVSRLSIAGYCMWMEYFDMEDAPEPQSTTNALVDYFESKGAQVF